MMQITAVRGALPEHRFPQALVTAAFADVILDHGVERSLLERLHGTAGVSFRHLAYPLHRYAELSDFGESNDAFIEAGVDLGARAVVDALKAADLTPHDVDLIISTTVTGIAVPSLDARVAARIGLRPDVKRVPIMGLGCVAGAAGLARLHDYLVGHPDEVGVLMSVELCSLTVQRQDSSVANLVASGLFGDGAAAVVAVGRNRATDGADEATRQGTRLPLVLASQSRLYPDTERALGYDVVATGFKIVLGAEVPHLVRTFLKADVEEFLDGQGLRLDDIEWWVCHPGGPKVIMAIQTALGLDRDDVALTWDSLDRVGNLSSASVLHILEDILRERPPRPGSFGLAMAMGPGFCVELVLLQG